MTPEEVVRAELKAWGGLDVDEIVMYFAEDADWYLSSSDSTISGLDKIRKVTERWVARIEFADLEVRQLLAAGSLVMTERVDHCVIDRNKIDIPAMGAFEVSGDKITAWRDYFHQTW